MDNCSIVEGKLTLKVEGGASIEDSIIMDEASTVFNDAFIELDDQGVMRVKYIGNNTMSMSRVDQYSQREDIGAADDDRKFTSKSLIIIICCSLFVGMVMLFVLLRSILCGSTTMRYGYHTL
jgi:hypothetical protein